MEPNKQKILKEKISYLITNQLKQNKFEVLAVYVDFDYSKLVPYHQMQVPSLRVIWFFLMLITTDS
jgi:hypothetical protein